MKKTASMALVILLLVAAGGTALAQSIMTTAVRGHVESQDGLALPGVAVSVKASTLQGSRTTVTSANGDYTFVGLPPGEYTVTFSLQGFKTVTQKVSLTTAQQQQVNTTMSLTGVEAAATVVAQAETVSTTTQASTTYTAELTQKLPVTRTIASAVNLTVGVNYNGVGQAASISGAQTFDNQFTVDGAVIMDNIRGTPNNLFIEDAVQETTTSVASISSEYGRFQGGIVNTITKSGGNNFSGSFRATLNNDAWSAVSPANETRVQAVSPTYEATLGGPFWKDHVWFFGSYRHLSTTGSGQTSFTLIPFETGTTETRWQAKLTLTPFQNQSITGNYLKVATEQVGNFFGVIMDLDSLVTRQLPQEILTINYNGVMSSSFFVEGLYSSRKFTFENSGSIYTDIIKGTLMRDRSRSSNARYNSPTFCGVCDPEERNNTDWYVKGTYFLSTEKLGAHNMVVGFDDFAGSRKANNYQSGSNYRLFTTSSIYQNGDIFPVIGANSYMYYTPIDTLSKGSDVRTLSAYFNDSWRLSDRLTFNLGVRWDKNNAKDSRGVVTADDSAWSPRLAVAWDVMGNGKLKVGASYARYVGAIQENAVDGASNAGQPALFTWYYNTAGATPINCIPTASGGCTLPPAGTPLVTRAQALQQVFNWFYAQQCPNLSTCKLPLDYAFVPGLSAQIKQSLNSPYTDEATFGVTGQIGTKGAYRVEYVGRKGYEFYNTVRDLSTGQVSDGFGNSFDVGYLQNTNNYVRRYDGLNTSFQYRISTLNFGANWTWSHLRGNIVGETSTSGPSNSAGFQEYPEYKQASWNLLAGNLTGDTRHRVRVFGSWDIPGIPQKFGAFNLGAIYQFDSGQPYGAVGTVRSRNYVTNPGYALPPSSVTYYYTPRDAFLTDDIKRTDLSLTYTFRIASTVDIFIQPIVQNLFNNQGKITVDSTVQTALSPGTGNTFLGFNPFTTIPIQRPYQDKTNKTSNWDLGPNFGNWTGVASFQIPRRFIVSAGVRF
jgi:hypothetical protein